MAFSIEIVSLKKEFYPAKSFFALLNPLYKQKPVLALDNINLQIKSGELFGLLGPNGAGKSTLIKILSCLVLPTEGKAKVAGYDIHKDEEKVKASIGLINGDERSFYWRLTGRQNLQFFASLYNLSSDQAKTRIKELLNFLEIDDPDKRFQEYSTGIKQRLSIARSLLHDPQVLFMDEPTKSLDPLAAQKLRKFIKEKLVCRQAKTILFSTHNLEEAVYLADRLAIMHKGRIKACGNNIKELCAEISECFSEK